MNRLKQLLLHLCNRHFWVSAVFCGLLIFIGVQNEAHPINRLWRKREILPAAFFTSLYVDKNGFEKYFATEILWRYSFIDLNGQYAAAQLKREIGNFDVVKDKDGMLYHRPFIGDEEEVSSENAVVMAKLAALAKENKAAFLYCRIPMKSPKDARGLEFYKTYSLTNYYETFEKMLLELRVPYADLSENPLLCDYFMTDNHWTISAGFYAAVATVAKLEDIYKLDIDPDGRISDINNYEQLKIPNCFYGSAAVRAGKGYTRADDVIFEIPKFETQYSYVAYNGVSDRSAPRSGDFSSVYVTPAFEKDGTFLYDRVVNWGLVDIINDNASSKLKLLYLCNSYGIAAVPYFSNYFTSVKYIATNNPATRQNLTDLVKSYNPDVIIVSEAGSGNITFEI